MKEVSQLYTQPKVKDEYELDYDKGKRNKHKEKKTYIQPNYDQIYQQLKTQPVPEVSDPNSRTKKWKGISKQGKHQNISKNKRMKDDD